MGKTIRLFTQALTTLGLALLLVNILGLVLSLRSPALAAAQTLFGPDDLVLSADQVRQLAARSEGEPTRRLVARATSAVNKGMAHDWTPGAYNLRVPAQENWVLWLFGSLNPNFQLWEYHDYQKALERGVGLCSEHAIVLNGLLREQGVRSQIVALGSLHVVNRVEVALDEWVIADPDFGITLPDLDALTPEMVRAAYAPLVSGGAAGADYYVKAYAEPVRIAEGVEGYNPGGAEFERQSYVLKWWIPALLIMPGAARMLHSRRRRLAAGAAVVPNRGQALRA